MLKKIPLLIISLFFLFSCENRVDNRVVQVDLANSMTNEQLSEIVKDIKIIPLESDTIIDRCSNIIVSGDNIFVLDKTKGRIMRFDLNGKLIKVIDRRGRASNEYLETTDFAISDNQIFVLDNNSQSIKEYDFDGNFKKSLPACTGSNIAVTESPQNRFIVYYGRDENGAINMFDESGNSTGSYMPLKKLPSSFSHSRPITVSGKDIYANNYFDCTIYKVKDSDITPYVSFDFGSKNMAADILNGDTPMAVIRKIISDKGVKVLDRTVVSNKWITFDAAGVPVFYNVKSDVPFVAGDKLSSPFSVLFYNAPYGVTEDGYYYTTISASNYVNAIIPIMDKYPFIKERNIKETDNDIIVFFKLN